LEDEGAFNAVLDEYLLVRERFCCCLLFEWFYDPDCLSTSYKLTTLKYLKKTTIFCLALQEKKDNLFIEGTGLRKGVRASVKDPTQKTAEEEEEVCLLAILYAWLSLADSFRFAQLSAM